MSVPLNPKEQISLTLAQHVRSRNGGKSANHSCRSTPTHAHTQSRHRINMTQFSSTKMGGGGICFLSLPLRSHTCTLTPPPVLTRGVCWGETHTCLTLRSCVMINSVLLHTSTDKAKTRGRFISHLFVCAGSWGKCSSFTQKAFC